MTLTEQIIAAGSDSAKVQELLAAYRKQLEAERGVGSLKISPKGAISIYGLGKFPVTLYLSQYEAFKLRLPEIDAFVEANRERLAVKPEKKAAETAAVN